MAGLTLFREKMLTQFTIHFQGYVWIGLGKATDDFRQQYRGKFAGDTETDFAGDTALGQLANGQVIESKNLIGVVIEAFSSLG